MKKTLSILLVLIALVTLICGCAKDNKASKSSASTALAAALDEVKNPDSEELSKTLLGSIGDDDAIMTMFNSFDPSLMYKNFDYEIISCEENGDTAVAKIKTTNIDYSALMKDYAEMMFTYIMEVYTDDMSEDEYNSLVYSKSGEALKTLLESGSYGTATREADITLTKTDGEWALDSELPADVILTGIDDFMNSMTLE